MPEQKVAIVVLHYNKLRLTVPCVQSLLESGYSPQHIYLFDNGSKPEIFRQIKQEFPACNHTRIEENKGYSGGFNRALDWVFSTPVKTEKSNNRYTSALFCTNDIFVSPGAAEACAAHAEKTASGMVAPLITYISNTDNIDSSAGYFNETEGTLHHYHEYELPTFLNPKHDYIPGTALWINKETFYNLGGTDESFHMYWEDVDLSFRAHRKGIPLTRCYEAIIRHGGGQTCRKKPLYTTFYYHRNRILFCKRYLEGETRKNTLQKIYSQLLESGSIWQEKGDNQRMEYLEKLLSILQDD